MRAPTTVRVRPILFSAPMVQATLSGEKTQTRRVVTPQPPPECSIHFNLGNESWLPVDRRTPMRHHWEAWHGALYRQRPEGYLCGIHTVKSPYGAVGDRLWVRETFVDMRDGYAPRDLGVLYAADSPPGTPAGIKGGWKPSIFMPRDCSRITLEITDVRVERLQSISDADARAEGVPSHCLAEPDESPECSIGTTWTPDGFARDNYRAIWDQLNAARGYGWHENPWVWVLAFRRVEVPDA